ncbi:uncharacterized protein BDZ99DRAFT_573452 [Mytilinidion resinicola]|uniref:TPR-like protein n=1 Tax=Mytilinidion resinicola TaxID=574789 RepID=A0A6A6YD10_9PEZI|nr:uncharacterized protein BDZ99DRAFT_573452 [Mytilinidion resinicola]KAF2806716.1 hypothetical protein BDZ99DRAFT_573452 [Mytilinidion resinicola]
MDPGVVENQMRHLLGVLSLLALDNVPQALLQQPISGIATDPGPRTLYGNGMLLSSLLMKLRSTAMIRLSSALIPIDRLTQAAFLDITDTGDKAEVFATAAMLVHQAFPKQHRGDPRHSQWTLCAVYSPHVRSLAERWNEFADSTEQIRTPIELAQVLCNAAWYLREINDFDGSLSLIETGVRAAEQNPDLQAEWELLIAHLLNTKGVVLWIQYDYTRSQEALERSRDIRSQELYQQAEKDHDKSPDGAYAKRLASCRYAATQGRLHTELGAFLEAEKDLQRSLRILTSGEDNVLYRRAIEYCFGNLRLAENHLSKAKTHYQSCLDPEVYPKSVTEKDQLRSCGCHYKLGYIALLDDQPEVADESLQKASDLATETGSLGWQGRITTLQASLRRKFPEVSYIQGDTHDQLDRRAGAIRAALAALSAEEEGSGKDFHIYILWQIW